MQEHEALGKPGTTSHTKGPYELTTEHMAKTNGVIPAGSVPPPDAERLSLRENSGEES